MEFESEFERRRDTTFNIVDLDRFVVDPNVRDKKNALNQAMGRCTRDQLIASYSHFRQIYAHFMEVNERAANFFRQLEPFLQIAFLSDNADYVESVLDKLDSDQCTQMLRAASAMGAFKTCKLLINHYEAPVDSSTVTLAFLSNSLDLVKHYIEKLEIGPKLHLAINFTAVTLDWPILNYLWEVYGVERLSTSNSNVLATAAFHPDKEKAFDFIKQSLEIFPPNSLSLLSAYEARNTQVFAAVLEANPELAASTRTMLIASRGNDADSSDDTKENDILEMHNILEKYDNDIYETNDYDSKESSINNRSMGF